MRTNFLRFSGSILLLLTALITLALYAPPFALPFALGTGCGALIFHLSTRARRAPDTTSASSSLDAPPARLASESLSPTVTALHASAARAPGDLRTTAEERLSASTLLEATMESMREGVLVIDRSMRVVAANRAAQALFSSVQGSLAERRLTELTRNSAIHQAFLTALERDERAEAKVETHHQDRLTFDIRVAPLRRNPMSGEERIGDSLHDSEVQGAVGIFFDITRLERLERIRQEFLSNVSHELRTPLTAILTFVETLESGAIDDQENNRRFLQIINRNASRMQNLINDILELSAIEAGTVQVEAAPLRLHNLVGDVFTALAGRAAERRIALHNEISSEVIVTGDRNRLEQMLTNLIDNGIKFNTEGGTVTVRHEREEARGRDLIIVSDTGEGIALEHIGRIFERFYRVDRARSRALGGTGLGLAIVKHLARAHGGEARVSSDANGSTFTIELPENSEVADNG